MPKGKKVCPECGIESGVRTSTCGCGHRFSFKQSSAPEEPHKKPVQTVQTEYVERLPQSPRLYSSVSCPLIQTPAGKCPIRPEGFLKKDWPNGPASNESIETWALKVFSSGNYLPDAVLYWIHEFWDMNLNFGKEYKRVREIVLKTLCGSQQETL